MFTVGSSDSIVAVSTGSTRAALSIVRLSGPSVPEIGRRLLVPFPEEPRRATLTTAREPGTGITLDQLIAVRYDAPRSYTGEAMLELSCHGGQATSGALLGACLALGARTAHPGEFTRRALLNGKLDLAQAEAVADLIDASSEPMRRVALGTVGGGLSKRVAELRNAILQLEAVMAYGVDFPEEDEGEVSREQILVMASEVTKRVTDLLETAGRGSIIRDGALVVFAGPPNVGKSSLFNALLGQERAIVTDIPGTTRDAIEHSCLIGTWPVRLVDTAGLRVSGDVVERLGIEVSERYVKDAEICVVCSDGTGLSLEEISSPVQQLGAKRVVAVQTKLDKRSAEGRSKSDLWVSAMTGEGLSELREAIAQALDAHYGTIDYENPIITRTRHAAMLVQASDELSLFVASMQAATTPTIAAVHLRAAVVALEEIIGAVSVDDLLDEVFSRFCVGK
ncbi:MAG: tRNA uridine-5-carboxymethylaminomethyl(34) synthesis GTPase MnmE [Gemmatimonadaceae bacterium]